MHSWSWLQIPIPVVLLSLLPFDLDYFDKTSTGPETTTTTTSPDFNIIPVGPDQCPVEGVDSDDLSGVTSDALSLTKSVDAEEMSCWISQMAIVRALALAPLFYIPLPNFVKVCPWRKSRWSRTGALSAAGESSGGQHSDLCYFLVPATIELLFPQKQLLWLLCAGVMWLICRIRVDALWTQLHDKDSHLEKLTAQRDAHESQVKVLEEQLAGLQTEKLELSSQRAQLEGGLCDAQKACETLEEQARELTLRNAELQSSLSQYKHDSALSAAAMQDLLAEKRQLQERDESAKRAHDRICQLEEDLAQAEQNRKSSEQLIDELQCQKAEQHRCFSQSAQKQKKAEEELMAGKAELEKQMAQLEHEKDQLQQELSRAENKSKSSEEQVQELMSQKAQLEHEKDRLQQQLSRAENKSKIAEEQVQELICQKAQLQRQLFDCERGREKLASDMEESREKDAAAVERAERVLKQIRLKQETLFDGLSSELATERRRSRSLAPDAGNHHLESLQSTRAKWEQRGFHLPIYCPPADARNRTQTS